LEVKMKATAKPAPLKAKWGSRRAQRTADRKSGKLAKTDKSQTKNRRRTEGREKKLQLGRVKNRENDRRHIDIA